LCAAGACAGKPIVIAPTAPPPPITPLPAGTAPLFAGRPPARLVLETRPLDVDPQGYARWLVRASFVDARGRPTELLRGGDVDFAPSGGSAQWQTRLRFGGPAAIVSTKVDGLLGVRVRADVGPSVPAASAATDTRRWKVARVVASALGPHAVWVGWFPGVSAGSVRIERATTGAPMPLARVTAPASNYVDTTVVPGVDYHYEVRLPGGRRTLLDVPVPAEPRHADRTALSGKKIWLAFSPAPLDPDGYVYLDPAAVVAKARAAGLRAIVLRMAYGPFEEITPNAKATIDSLIDQAAAHGIATIAWTVPRSTSFEDLAATAGACEYATPSGNAIAAVAVDLERGGYYLGDGPAGYAALGSYLPALRTALGPGFPILATVEDPYLEQLTNATYPYDKIAASADVLQPMAYWRMLSSRALTPDDVRTAIGGSFAATLREAGRRIPIDMGLQSSAQGPRGAPPPAEVAASIAESRALGAVGVTFFDWSGTPKASWDVLAASPW